ncbi:hypothetical protein B0H19DRAFT_1366890 [Mycena capillaripes]|nr:hypothetical protein B0H19DRAFT_1366890 [Mycena capillaripes]
MTPAGGMKIPSNTHKQPTPSERVALAADRAHIVDIDAQIMEMESALNSLKEKKKLAQDRLDAYTYPILILPNEIVSEIFVHVLPVYPKCPPPIGLLSPYLLCRICREWRNIALATPALWRAISLSLHKTKRFAQKLQLLESSLKRSGSCLLSIKLISHVPDSELAQFGQKIAGHSTRWEHLELSIPVPCALPDIGLSLPSLRTLKLGAGISSTTSTFLAAPLLRKVIILLGFRDVYRSIFPWSQLTVVSVGYITPDQCAHLSNELVNVIYYHFLIDDSDYGELSLRAITMPRLETLLLGTFSSWMPKRLLDKLTLPALRQLQVPQSPREPEEDAIATIVSLVSRSGCNLQELAIPGGITFKTRLTVSRSYRVALPSVRIKLGRTLAITEPLLMESNDGDVTDSSDGEYSYNDAETIADSEATDSDSECDDEESD